MTWKDVRYEIADKLFNGAMDEAFRQGQHSGLEYASRKIGFAVRNLDTKIMTKTQRIGYDASMTAIAEAKKEIMIKTGVTL
tara:strand:- start:2685 stop:2927 length:243 start_codon:yes stop_codon:yes gene_type:complete